MNLEEKPYIASVRLDNPPDIKSYPYSLIAVQQISSLSFHPDVTFVVGENGTGKSTLLEALAANLDINPEGGNKNTHFETKKTHSSLYNHIKVSKSYKRPTDWYFLRAESFYNLATYTEDKVEDFTSYGKPLHRQSHGESFLSVLTNKLKGNGLYLLDEPEAALSPTRQLAALVAINELVKHNSQFIIATHSPILMSYPRSKIYYLDKDGVTEKKYSDIEHVQITQSFLNNPQKMLEELLSSDM